MFVVMVALPFAMGCDDRLGNGVELIDQVTDRGLAPGFVHNPTAALVNVVGLEIVNGSEIGFA